MNLKTENGERIETKKLIGHILMFSVLIFIIAAFQASFFGAAGFFKATPDLLLAAVFAIGITEGEKHGAACGIWAGVMSGALGGSGTLFMPLFYMLMGYSAGVLIRYLLSRNLLSWLIYMIFAVTIREMVSVIVIIITEKQIEELHLLTKTVVPEALLTYLFSIPVFFLVKLCAKPFHNENQTYELQ